MDGAVHEKVHDKNLNVRARAFTFSLLLFIFIAGLNTFTISSCVGLPKGINQLAPAEDMADKNVTIDLSRWGNHEPSRKKESIHSHNLLNRRNVK
jgi:hypothetical protein